MGSSCSSRQSGKDSASIRSEESQNEKQAETVTGRSEPEEKRIAANVKDRDRAGGRFIESDFSSCGDEGTATFTPLSSSAGGSLTDASRSRQLDKGKPSAELPSFVGLKDDVRNLIMGTVEEGKKSVVTDRFCVCMLGSTQDSSKDLVTVQDLLSESLIPSINRDGKEVFIINTQNDIPILRSSYIFSDLICDYLIDNSRRCCLHVILYTDSNLYVTELPPFIPKSHFQTLELSLGEDSDVRLLNKWYKEDNCFHPSVYRLQFYQALLCGLQSEDKSKYENAYSTWSSEYKNIVNCLLKASSKDFRSTFLKHLLIKEFSCLKDDAASDVHFQLFINDSENSSRLEYDATALEDEFQSSVSNNTVKIAEAAVGTEAQLQSMASQIEASVKKSLQSHDSKTSLHPLEDGIKKKLLQEVTFHNDYCRHCIQSHPWTSSHLDRVKEYVTGESHKPLLLCGERGSGKSTLAALVASRSSVWNTSSHCIARFVGLTESSSSVEGLLYYLYEHSVVLLGPSPEPLTMNSLGRNIASVWKKASPERSLLVIIDGIDEFDYNATLCALDWLFAEELPPSVKVVLTLQQTSSLYENLLAKIKDQTFFLKIGHTEEESKDLFNTCFMKAHDVHYDPSPTWEKVRNSSCSLTPLYIMIISQLIMLASVEEKIPPSLEDSIQELFRTLEKVFPKEMLQLVLGCLSITRIGLLQAEIFAIIKSASFHSPSHSLDWILLQQLLSPLLRIRYESRFVLISWSSQYVRGLASTLFLDSSDKQLRCQEIFRKAVNLEESEIFDTSSWSSGERSLRHTRNLQETSTFLRMRTAKEDAHFFSYAWLMEKTKLCTPLQLLDDLTEAAEDQSSGEIRILKDVIRLSIIGLMYEESQLYLQIYGRLKWYLETEETCPNLSCLLQSLTASHHTRLIPLSPCLEMPKQLNCQEELVATADASKAYFDSIFCMPNNPHHVITISAAESQVAVWNIIEMKAVRILNGINQPRNLEMIDDYKCLLLCGRELRIYNLNEGTFLMKLREVMNQKMPFFGLHNSDHVVALSRSRMYVNMMNLTEGNCVTTFKVGEDRFLNSLLVSQNGKICVCGDDSQKPSALLVWNLELRKLMYDLRIPHHEFATRLAAITIEGHYVCCVCKEVDDPAPNFIVVYDLQSGTLFKRWKPDVNTISITISTGGTCVIVGLENSSIMAYDLITGNPRWTVRGHCAPPDTFRMDQHGSVLLSYESTGRDQSLRVWDIQSGENLAVFTPDQRITACEITNDAKAVILALEGKSQLLSFILCRRGEELDDMIPSSQPYGEDEHHCKVFDLAEQ